MKIEVTVKDFPETHYIYVRHIGLYSECKHAWDKLMCWIVTQNMLNKLMFWNKTQRIFAKNSMCFGLCHDDPDKTNDCRYDACFSITQESLLQLGKLPKRIQIGTVSSGKYAMTLVQGPYEAFYAVYTELFGGVILKLEEIDFTKPTLEKYLNSPQNTKPKDLLTEIYIPMK